MKQKPDIPDNTFAKWQKSVDLIATLVGIPAALIMKVNPQEIEVFVSSETESNPYEKGERAHLNTGLYCETVMAQRAQLLVPDARKDPEWDHNPDIELDMVSYLGFPLIWPDGEIFGTICVLDNKENSYSSTHQKLLAHFREVLEVDLQMTLEQEKELKQAKNSLQENEERLKEAQRIAHLGNWEWDIVQNELIWSDEIYRIFGLEPQEFDATYEAFLKAVHPDDREFVEKSVDEALNEGKTYSINHRIVLPDRSERIVHEHAEVAFGTSGKPIRMIGTVQDVTELKRTEEQIKAQLREKEVLLQEIHHRVKNNLQIISSLIKLQSKHIKDEEVLELLKDTRNRVQSMAVIHDRLYKSENFSRVDFAEYLQSLADHLFSSYGTDSKAIKLHVKVKDVSLDINTAIPCGLILNEIISNSLKHAFPDGRKGKIKIVMKSLKKNEIELTVSDNGIGIPDDVDFRETESLGLHLVSILAEDQLRGKIKLDKTKGTRFQIKFKAKQ